MKINDLMNLNTQTLIHHFFEQSARRYPDKIALIHEEVRATYTQINNMANHLAHWLIGQGVTNGDRVAILLENSLEYVISYYGILKAGAVAAPLSTDLKPDGLKPLLEELEPGVVISSSRFERLLQVSDLDNFSTIQTLVLSRSKLKWPHSSFQIFSLEELSKGNNTSNPDISLQESELAGIIYTSGSTGKPKGVMLSHLNIVSNTSSICQYLNLTENDIQMVVLPFFYVMGKSLLNTHFAAGGTIVINNKFAYPASVINQMVDEKVTGFSGVPSTYAYLLHRSPLVKNRDNLGSLRYCSQAGGHMSRQIKEELRQVLPEHTQICIMYGATEASARLTYLEPEAFEQKMESIGRAIPGVTMRVLNGKGEALPAGETGELVGAGPNIMQGYWKDKKATREVLDHDGYHTGDLGYQDEEGYLYVTGRKDNLLKVGGHRINTQEIEDAIMATKLVIEAAVLGKPDKLLGNRLIAVIVPKNEDCSGKQILSSCAGKLPKYKLPGEIIFARSLPKSLSGKIDKPKCLELAIKE
jgi:acyl-CoA synthetase (AMP-forming)/AMP-acid ligase II